MPEVLDHDAIDAALGALPGWTYDGEALVKRADVPDDSQDAMERSVGAIADALDHHPAVTREPDALTFRLWTHSAGGVTAKDVDLAARIDQVLTGAQPGRDA
ncbi:MAG TPA: 4a-hydroxytetrahydrobiopterin dehydratase [Actinomycetes bacterium]|nr:4a-hydroxytetrahydrobiopterin dehydratase [Actinomycetes bacterium]